MKTDFEYDPGSVSFSLIVSLQTKNSKVLTLKDNWSQKLTPEDGNDIAGFHKGLRDITIDSVIERLTPDIGLEGTQYEGREQRAEKVQVGDLLELVMEPDDVHSSNVIDLRNHEGSLGHLPEWIAVKLVPLLSSRKITCKTKVTEVKKFVNRSSNLEELTIYVHIDAKKTNDNDNFRLSSVEEICKFIRDETEYLRKSRVVAYTKDIAKYAESTDDICSIIFEREYTAEGKYADYFAEHDEELRELAKKVVHSKGMEKDEAKKRMLEYINAPNVKNIHGHGYGLGFYFKDIRYSLKKKNDIEPLARTLSRSHTNSLPAHGVEHSEINLETGVFSEYAIFDLD